MKQFEIKSHDGPGRYGKLGDLETPAIIDKDDFSIADDESSAYDVEKEIARLTKDLKNVENEITRADRMLNNQGFIAKAPAALVEQEKAKLALNQQKLEQVTKRIEELKENM